MIVPFVLEVTVHAWRPVDPQTSFSGGLTFGGYPYGICLPPTRIPQVAGIQIHGLDRLSPIFTAMVVGAR